MWVLYYCVRRETRNLQVDCQDNYCLLLFDSRKLKVEARRTVKEYVEIQSEVETVVQLSGDIYVDGQGRLLVRGKYYTYIILLPEPLWKLLGFRNLTELIRSVDCYRAIERPPSPRLLEFLDRLLGSYCFSAFRASEAIEASGLSRTHAYVLLHRLTRIGALLRVGKGKYVVNKEWLEKYGFLLKSLAKCNSNTLNNAYND